MDVNLGTEEMLTESTSEYLARQMGVGDDAYRYQYLSVQSFVTDGADDVAIACSEMQTERKQLLRNVQGRLGQVLPSLNEVPEQGLLGVMTITVKRADADVDNAMWAERRNLMRTGLRHVLAAWAAVRKRFIVVMSHSGEYVNDNSEEVLPDHLHAVYIKNPYDRSDQLAAEIRDFVIHDCSWETIDTSMGIFGAAETPAFDEGWDEGELPDDAPFDEDIEGADSSETDQEELDLEAESADWSDEEAFDDYDTSSYEEDIPDELQDDFLDIPDDMPEQEPLEENDE